MSNINNNNNNNEESTVPITPFLSLKALIKIPTASYEFCPCNCEISNHYSQLPQGEALVRDQVAFLMPQSYGSTARIPTRMMPKVTLFPGVPAAHILKVHGMMSEEGPQQVYNITSLQGLTQVSRPHVSN